MKTKGKKIFTPGWGVATTIGLIGIKNPNGHLEWISSVSSSISKDSVVWGVTLFNHRSGNNRQGLLREKYDKYLGSGPIDSNSTLELTYMSSFKNTDKHHSTTPIDPYILLSA